MLDTNTCIYLIKNNPPHIAEKFNQYRKGDIVISAITWAELCCGLSKDGKALINQLLTVLDVLPFGVTEGQLYGELTASLPNRKGNLDRMIAAHAIALGATLVTNNVADFAIYQAHNLCIENWVK